MGRQGEQFREQLEFLMQATEMLKRRLREMSKHQTPELDQLLGTFFWHAWCVFLMFFWGLVVFLSG